MTPLAAPGAVWLTWNSARLLALILNSLTGSLIYYERELESLGPDGVLGLRILEGQMDQLYINYRDKGYHKDIFSAIRNISMKASELAAKGSEKLEERDPGRFKAGKSLFSHGFRMKIQPARQTDERMRWQVKEHFNEKSSRVWFDVDSGEMKCLFDFTSSTNCTLSESCIQSMLTTTGLNGYQLTNQLLYLTIAQNLNCAPSINSTLLHLRNKTILDQTQEFCTNILGELDKYKRDKKKLARIDHKSLDLMMEQVFVCGINGFVEFVDTHFIVAGLGWQNPELGCWTRRKSEPVNTGLSGDLKTKKEPLQSSPGEACLPHLSAVTTGALITALRFLLDPPPWPEYHSAADQLISADRIVSEDRFHFFKYIEWVRDFPADMRIPRPPPVAWAPDLVAFMFLLFVFLIGSVVAHSFCTPGPNNKFIRTKRLYPFAYKKL
ncbi:hypothetical protein FO519_002059 [Halicephalobus sp. NKZ332]|nr:hypothetical protein FO519_002059 [Halicephalobus sp. NKZ332]